MILGTLLKSLMPTVRKLVDGGKVDGFIRSLKERYSEREELMTGESVEILLTTEIDGCEYANLVVLTPERTIRKLIAQQRLSELITSLFNEAEI
jgi:hypothetical protein